MLALAVDKLAEARFLSGHILLPPAAPAIVVSDEYQQYNTIHQPLSNTMDVKDEDDMEVDQSAASSGVARRERGGTGDSASDRRRRVYLPGTKLEDEEELTVDESVYRILHSFQAAHSCLSLDHVVTDDDSMPGTYPLSTHLVAGTSSEDAKVNSLQVIRLSNVHPTSKHEKEDSSSDESEASDDEDIGPNAKAPRMHTVQIPLKAAVNRVRACQLGTGATVCSVWLDVGRVEIWNLSPSVKAVSNMAVEGRITKETVKKQAPLSSFTGHLTEGFAMDWSPLSPGNLLTGDSRKNVHLWRATEAGTWVVDQLPYKQHKGSVEDIQWSPTEAPVFASCSADKTIRLWDTRPKPADACLFVVEGAHDKDVSVMSWSRNDPFLLTGGDDCLLKVWDLRLIRSSPRPVARLSQHGGPITSVGWSPHEATVFGAAGEDDQLTLWDLAMERDQEEEGNEDDVANAAELAEVPPQLLFIHQGQSEIKELRWHPKHEGLIVTTALDSFNVFRTINV